MSRLDLALLGAPRVSIDGRALSFPTRKALALLIYLAVERGAHTRARLAALLWPDSDAAHSRLSLRRTLGQLRDVLGERDPGAVYLRAAEDTLQLIPAGAALDLDLLRDLSRPPGDRPALEAALAAYRGDFLDGFSLPDAPEFDTWASIQRELWHRQLALALDQLAALAFADGEMQLALATAQRWVAHDPLNEAAHRRLIEAHAALGARALALQAYAALKAALARELGLAPAAETEALVARLRQAPAGPGSGVSIAAPRHSAPSPAQPADLPMVGRAGELRRIIAGYQAAREQGAQVIVIAGEAGIGKTRLAAEFLRWSGVAGADVLRGRAFEAGGRVPYQPVVDALRPRLDRENAPADLLDDVWLAELARLLPELRERYPDLPPPIDDEPTARIRLFESVLLLLLGLCGRAPAVLFVDDIQWADSASLDLIHYCVRRLTERHAPLLTLCTMRSEDLIANPALAAWLASLRRDGALTQLDLAALSAEDTELLLAACVAPGQGEHERAPFPLFSSWLFGETGGQPLYVIETLKVLIDRGVLAPEADPARPAQLRLAADLNTVRGLVPPTVRDIIRARRALLSPDAQALLAAAAVLGHSFSFEQVRAVAGLAEPAGLAALDQALEHRLLVERAEALGSQHDASRYMFSHDKIRDVVYTEAGDPRRRIYHRRAFQALAQAPASERAHHALAGGLLEAAYTDSIAAGDEALRLFAVEDAIGAYEQARSLLDLRAADLGLAAGTAQAPHLYLQLGRSYELRSALDQAGAIYRELLAMARARGWAATECAALNRLATVLVQQAVDIAAALDLLHEAQALATRTGSMADLAETEWNLAQVNFYNSQPERARAHGMRALQLAREHELPELAARSLNVLALAASAMAHCGQAARYAEAAGAAYAALGNRALQADSLSLAGSALVNQGRIQEGLDKAREADAINRTIGNLWGMAASQMTLAGGLCDSGRYGEALAAAANAVQLVRERPLAMLLILTLGVLGMVQRAALQLDAALATHLEAWELVVHGDARLMIDMIGAELCADYLLAGDMPAAARYARAALERRDHIFTIYMGRLQWHQAAALAWAGDAELARADLGRFDQRIGPQQRYRIGSWYAQALLAYRAGDGDTAVAALEAALDAADRLALPGEQWLLLSSLAACYQARGAAGQAREAQARAAALIQQLAATLADADASAAFVGSAGAAGARVVAQAFPGL